MSMINVVFKYLEKCKCQKYFVFVFLALTDV